MTRQHRHKTQTKEKKSSPRYKREFNLKNKRKPNVAKKVTKQITKK